MVSKWMIHCLRVQPWFVGVATIPQQQCQLIVALNALWKPSKPKRHCWEKLLIFKQDICICHKTTFDLTYFSIGWLQTMHNSPCPPHRWWFWGSEGHKQEGSVRWERQQDAPKWWFKQPSCWACQNLCLGPFWFKKKNTVNNFLLYWKHMWLCWFMFIQKSRKSLKAYSAYSLGKSTGLNKNKVIISWEF